VNILIIEDASLEILPKEFATSKEAKLVTQRFGISPNMQILDKNFHRKIIESLAASTRRGRPDLVHFALLDAASTPLFADGLLRLYVRTIRGVVIEVKRGTRLPRTLQRFCGVMAKLLSRRYGEEEAKLFNVQGDMSFPQLINVLKAGRIITLTPKGSLMPLHEIVKESSTGDTVTAWIVGGFPRGDFADDVARLSHRLVSISPRSLAAHVVTARLCYELEEKQKSSSLS
jgi:rRNA small subunit pseudouridine methyltransferase Nep1